MKVSSGVSVSSVLIWKVQYQAGSANLIPVEMPVAVHSLDQASHYLPPGAYTTLRTYPQRKVLHLEGHFRRLEDTAAMVDVPVTLDRSVVRQSLRQALAHFPEGVEARVRLTLDLDKPFPDLFILAEKLTLLPPVAYQQGVKAILCDLQRQLPRAKLTRFIERSNPLRQSLPPDVNEALMVGPQGDILEGLSSNFFGVRNEVIYTADDGVLAGTTRQMVLDGIDQLNLELQCHPVRVSDLVYLTEAFITSASRAILPVRQVAEYQIGPLCPGPVTRRLMTWFETRLGQVLEEI